MTAQQHLSHQKGTLQGLVGLTVTGFATSAWDSVLSSVTLAFSDESFVTVSATGDALRVQRADDRNPADDEYMRGAPSPDSGRIGATEAAGKPALSPSESPSIERSEGASQSPAGGEDA